VILLLAACASPPPAQPNVLLVSMDTVRFDRTSLAGGRDTTPNLAGLAAEGVSFTQAYSVANESLYSHAALFTGRYPSEVARPDYASFALPRAGTATLAEVLSAYGYRTAAFTGGGHVVADFGFDRGFTSFAAAGGDAGFASFFDTVPPAVAWMRAQGEAPWFCFVHGYDAHSPYVQRGPARHPWGASGSTERLEQLLADPLAAEQLRGPTWFPERQPRDFTHAAGRSILGTDFYRLPAEPGPGERVETLGPGELAHLQDHYDSGVLQADLWLGVLLAHVDLRDTLVIVVADHGEDVLDHGYMNHRAGLWDSTLHVPLVVAGPGFPVGEVRDGLVDLRSVVPTVVAAVGATAPAGLTAPPLQTGDEPAVVFAEGVMDEVSARSRDARFGMADVHLAAGFQPGEGVFYVGDQPAPGAGDPRADTLRAAIVAWRAALPPASGEGVEIPAALREALRERGYWTP
jgi:arylsulfatase A-like enzyme